MRYRQLNLALIIIQISISACSTNKKLLEKSKSEFGVIEFYFEAESRKSANSKRVLGIVDNTLFYSFYVDKIIKQTKQEKNLIMTLFDGDLPTSFDSTAFQKLSSLDSVILIRGNKILDSLGLTNYKNSKKATAFVVEVNNYHGYPKGKRFRP